MELFPVVAGWRRFVHTRSSGRRLQLLSPDGLLPGRAQRLPHKVVVVVLGSVVPTSADKCMADGVSYSYGRFVCGGRETRVLLGAAVGHVTTPSHPSSGWWHQIKPGALMLWWPTTVRKEFPASKQTV